MSAEKRIKKNGPLDQFSALARTSVESRWRQQEHPMPIVVAIIEKRNQQENGNEEQASCLLIRRTSEPYRGCWALIGGKWDFGETLADAIVREVEEETSLLTVFDSLVGLVNERLVPEKNEASRPAQFLLFVCRLSCHDGVPTEQTEGEVAWFTWSEIELMNQSGGIIPSDYLMLKQFAGAAPISHYEVDMIASDGKTADNSGSYIARFEHFC